MCRPGSSFVHQVIAGALVALAVGGCGKGLYTHASQFKDSGGSGGGVIDPGTGAGTGGGTSTSPDTNSGDGGSNRNPDAAPKYDAETGPCPTRWVSNGTLTVIPCEEATLILPKDSVPTGGPYPVTLKRVSSDGTLVLQNDQGMPQDYSGTSGPIFSITAGYKILWNTVTLKIRVTPDPSIPLDRMGLASVDELSKAWIKAPDPMYNPETHEVSGTVTNPNTNPPPTRYFAPVETCPKETVTETCHLDRKCIGEACQ